MNTYGNIELQLIHNLDRNKGKQQLRKKDNCNYLRP